MFLHSQLMTKESVYASVRGENLGGPNPLQKIQISSRDSIAVLTSNAIRSQYRDAMNAICVRENLPIRVNRSRVTGELLAVKYVSTTQKFNKKNKNTAATPIHDPELYVDDALMGYLEIETGENERRDSAFRVNVAQSFELMKSEDVLFHQSPSPEHLDEKSVQLFQDECIYSAFHYPISINISQLEGKFSSEMVRVALQAITELGHVGGNSARYVFEMQPINGVISLTNSVGNIPAFKDKNDYMSAVDAIIRGEVLGDILLAGKLFWGMPDVVKETLPSRARVVASVNEAFDIVSKNLTGKGLYGR